MDNDTASAEAIEDEGKEKRSITFSLILAYFFGGSGLLLGILNLSRGSTLAGVFLLLAGVIGFPQSRRQIEDTLNVELSKWVATGIFLVLWMTGAALL